MKQAHRACSTQDWHGPSKGSQRSHLWTTVSCVPTPRAGQEVGEGLPGVALAVDPAGREGGFVAVGDARDEAYRQGLPDSSGLPPPGRLAGLASGGVVRGLAWNEVTVTDEVPGMGPQAEDGMQAQLESPR